MDGGGLRRKRIVLVAMLTGVGCLVVVATASAGHWKLRLTKVGGRAARAAVLHQSDLGSGWTGSAAKPTYAVPCAANRRGQLPPVAIGAAKIQWTNGTPGISIKSQAIVLRSAKMLPGEWKRTVVAPRVLACTRKQVASTLSRGEKLVSLAWQPFPQLTKYTREARAVVSVKGVQVVVDFLAIGAGRDELTLTFTEPGSGSTMNELETIVARRLLARLAAR